jgi:hypothetical protein
MRKSSVLFITLSLLTSSLFGSAAFADIEWSGVYRIEAYNLKNAELGGKKRELDYGLSHLVLRPKIVAGDGFTINGQFDIFNNATYPASQMGSYWGGGMRDASDPAATRADASNSMSNTQRPESIHVSQLYLTLNNEYGALVVGRVPLHFGLGIFHNSGKGLFDHWYDTDDLVGYKVVLGNLWILPMIGKNSEGAINNSDDVNDYMIQAQYENPESDVELGVFYQVRTGGDQASDAPIGTAADGEVLGGQAGGAANHTGKVNTKTVSVYALKDTERFRLGLEAAFQSGDSGVMTSNGNDVTWGGFGIAGEFEYRPEGSHWKWGLKSGLATGDDPNSAAKFEGFLFNRNYDVAMLMFNHPLGQADFLRTKLLTGNVYENPASTDPRDKHINTPDVETISNTIYLAPTARYAFNDHWSLDNTIITGWLETNPIAGSSNPGKELGYEWDISLNFSPRKGVMWINQAGLLFPGGVWKGGDTGNGKAYESSFAYGLGTKAAISF